MRFGKGYYEPKYRLTKYMSTANELEIEHRAWIEDQFANPPPALASSKWAMVGVVTSEVNPSIVNCVRKTKCVASQSLPLNLTEDVNAAVCQFFVSGTTPGVWIIPNGSFVGQTIRIRKTSVSPFEGNVVIRIRNQSLSIPNVQSDEFVMSPQCSVLAWCWDGSRWFLE